MHSFFLFSERPAVQLPSATHAPTGDRKHVSAPVQGELVPSLEGVRYQLPQKPSGVQRFLAAVHIGPAARNGPIRLASADFPQKLREAQSARLDFHKTLLADLRVAHGGYGREWAPPDSEARQFLSLSEREVVRLPDVQFASGARAVAAAEQRAATSADRGIGRISGQHRAVSSRELMWVARAVLVQEFQGHRVPHGEVREQAWAALELALSSDRTRRRTQTAQDNTYAAFEQIDRVTGARPPTPGVFSVADIRQRAVAAIEAAGHRIEALPSKPADVHSTAGSLRSVDPRTLADPPAAVAGPALVRHQTRSTEPSGTHTPSRTSEVDTSEVETTRFHQPPQQQARSPIEILCSEAFVQPLMLASPDRPGLDSKQRAFGSERREMTARRKAWAVEFAATLKSTCPDGYPAKSQGVKLRPHIPALAAVLILAARKDRLHTLTDDELRNGIAAAGEAIARYEAYSQGLLSSWADRPTKPINNEDVDMVAQALFNSTMTRLAMAPRNEDRIAGTGADIRIDCRDRLAMSAQFTEATRQLRITLNSRTEAVRRTPTFAELRSTLETVLKQPVTVGQSVTTVAAPSLGSLPAQAASRTDAPGTPAARKQAQPRPGFTMLPLPYLSSSRPSQSDVARHRAWLGVQKAQIERAYGPLPALIKRFGSASLPQEKTAAAVKLLETDPTTLTHAQLNTLRQQDRALRDLLAMLPITGK